MKFNYTGFKNCIFPSLVLIFLTVNISWAQDDESTGSGNRNIWQFLTRPQHEYRQLKPVYVGVTLQGIQAGYHLKKKISLNLSYTPKNYFRKVDGLEVGGISEGLGFTDGARDNTIFEITGVEDYENIDKHLIILDSRYFIWQSLFVSVGYGFATGSERTVFFTEESRTIGNGFYNDLDIDVNVRLKNAHSVNLGAGFHHFFGPVGVGFSGVFGLYPRVLKSTTITSNQTLSPEDEAILRSIVKKEVGRENYGFYQFMLSLSFKLGGSN